MEIIPSSRVRTQRRGRRILGVLASAFLLTGLVAALPVLLGQQRIAMADDAMGGTIPRGSFVVLRQVSASEVRAGDVVSVADPAGDGSVVRRVAVHDGGWLELRGDAPGVDVTTVRAVRVRAVERHIPWVGYPLLLLGPWPAPYLVLALVGACVLVGLRVTRPTSLPTVSAEIVIPRQATGPRRGSPEAPATPAPPPPPSGRAAVATTPLV